ncbi:2-phosphosulfolactate phosphatase [Brevibacillus parabrevis]|uniref:2-phosphosulfolactate phosphatase n=1 Tax=Brevibacillus parabrevis TaxID=54914 RepID=UPI002E21A994|nr:2-phosphosulfolactate phosphatase [Brevibacillus parabrevis]MED1724622.1 2-phosphosulfolactate phosphatase [Brevibacillus parabrevis]
MLKEASIFKQLDYSARFEWGYEGVEELAGHSDILVIIDVLSFTTCVDIVCGRGGVVYPYRTRDETAAFFAQKQGALLAGKRGEPLSLSPSCLMTLPEGSKIVLPSPNGSTCTVLAQQSGATIIAGCLRNAGAVARFISARQGTVSIIACGERWPNGALRPAVEDMLAAGAILDELTGFSLSCEAQMAVGAFRAAKQQLGAMLYDCGSGRELAARGFTEDVTLAAQWNHSQTVPVLRSDLAYEASR